MCFCCSLWSACCPSCLRSSLTRKVDNTWQKRIRTPNGAHTDTFTSTACRRLYLEGGVSDAKHLVIAAQRRIFSFFFGFFCFLHQNPLPGLQKAPDLISERTCQQSYTTNILIVDEQLVTISLRPARRSRKAASNYLYIGDCLEFLWVYWILRIHFKQ